MKLVILISILFLAGCGVIPPSGGGSRYDRTAQAIEMQNLILQQQYQRENLRRTTERILNQ